MDGRLFPAQGVGWGWAMGRRSRAVGLGGSREGEGLLLLCATTLPFTHTGSGWDAGGRISPGPPVLARAASRCQGGQDEALLLLPMQRSGMEGTALQMRCCHHTPQGTGCLGLPAGPGCKPGVPRGSSSSIKGAPHPLHPGSPDPSPRAASSKLCPCGMEALLARAGTPGSG